MNMQIFHGGRVRTGPRSVVGALALVIALFVVTALPIAAAPIQQATLSSAARVAAQLSTPYSSIVSLTDYTARSDPERILGLPGQYVAKAQFSDSRGVTGIVEVFATENDRIRRQYALGGGDGAASIWYGRVLLRLYDISSDEHRQAYKYALGNIYLP